MEPEVAAALVTGGISLIVSLFSAAHGLKSQKTVEVLRSKLEGDIEKLKGEIADKNSAASARRDYEYDARKRLYVEVEPLLFQIYEALEEAHYRVRSLARTSRQGDLSGDSNWMGHEGYYLRSTIYKIILPAAHIRRLQSRITFVDLELDRAIWLRFMLLKLYVRSFTDDFNFAGQDPQLEYDPYSSKSPPRAVSKRQGLVLGDLENIAESMIVRDATSQRAMSFGEFEKWLDTNREDSTGELVQLFHGFSPKATPVLARLLVAQACFSQLILASYDVKNLTIAWLNDEFNRIISSSDQANSLAWHEKAPQDLRISQKYWAERIGWLSSRQPWSQSEVSPIG